MNIKGIDLSQNQQSVMPQPLYCDEEHYWLAINKLLEYSNQHQVFGQWIEDNFESDVVNVLFERQQDEYHDGQPLRVLGVGSGAGYKEILQMKKLTTKFSSISATVVEPSKEIMAKYQDAVRAERRHSTGIEYEWRNQSFQDYVNSVGSSVQKYHFISTIHSMYYMGESEEVIRSLYHLLEPGGVMLMALFTEHKGVGNLQKLTATIPADENTTLNGTPTSVQNKQRLKNSSDVQAVLGKLQIPYTKSSVTESVDVTPCFNQEDSVDAQLVLDAVTIKKGFKKSATDTAFHQVMGYLRDNLRVCKTGGGCDKYLFDSENDVFIIHKITKN